jgi:hypothetical protein
MSQQTRLPAGEVFEVALPGKPFCEPVHDRTKQFLRRVTEAGRL